MLDIGENLTAIISTCIVSISAIIAGILKYLSVKKKNDSKMEALAAAQTKLSESMLLMQDSMERNNSITTSIYSIIELKFRSAVADSTREIMELKQLAWDKQQTDFVSAVKRIIIANHLDNREVTIMKIKSTLTQVIEVTDASLGVFNISNFIANTKEKIKFINNSEFPNIIYQIIIDNKNDSDKLESNSRSICQQMLQAVKNEFYDDNNRVKGR